MIPLLISMVTFISFTSLLWLGKIGEASYAFLMGGAALSSLVLHGFARLQIGALISAIGIDSLEAKEARKFIEKYDEIDRLFAGRDALRTTDPDYAKVKAQIGLLNEQINTMLRKDVDNTGA